MATQSLEFSAMLWQPIPRDAWSATFIGCTDILAEHQRVALLHWGLEETFIIIPDEPPIPAIGITVLEFWVGLAAYLLLHPGLCAEDCPKARFWE